ncbi:MAG: preprotein translocase subunit SecE [Anaerolineaceae bacterium]|nr:preprotein translocase subunit SecE [Anaerolineaceae bacterium]
MARKKKSDKKKPVRKQNRMVSWWRETIGELRKVSWPTPQEALRLTRIVIIVMVAMSAFLGVSDFIFSRLIRLLFA